MSEIASLGLCFAEADHLSVAGCQVELPTGYWLEWGGEFENQQRAAARLALVVPVAVGLIFLVLFSTFRSVKQALLVLSNVPFALIGGVAATLLLKWGVQNFAAGLICAGLAVVAAVREPHVADGGVEAGRPVAAHDLGRERAAAVAARGDALSAARTPSM
mgnify:CR=1 FL=1